MQAASSDLDAVHSYCEHIPDNNTKIAEAVGPVVQKFMQEASGRLYDFYEKVHEQVIDVGISVDGTWTIPPTSLAWLYDCEDEGDYWCPESRTCILSEWICDGDMDCQTFGEDERNCGQRVNVLLVQVRSFSCYCVRN